MQPLGSDEFRVLAIAIPSVLFVFLVVIRAARTKNSIPSLVLRDFRLSHSSQQGVYVGIEGRPEGLWSWILTVMGLGTDIRFEVSGTDVQREKHSPSSRIIDSVPLQNVASINFGSVKALPLLVLALLVMFAGAAGFLITFMSVSTPKAPSVDLPVFMAASAGLAALGLLFLLAYALSKRLVIQVETAGGRFIGVRFKPSILGQLHVDLKEASRAVQIINSLIARGSAAPFASAHKGP